MRSSFSSSASSSRLDDDASRESNFSQKANGYLETLGEKLETWADESSEEEVECEYSDGVLTISLGAQRGTYVLNKQAPNKQIWWSSPISGPHRFEEDLSPKENVELNFSVDVDDKNDDDDDDEDDATTNDFERHRHCRLDGVEAVATTPDT